MHLSASDVLNVKDWQCDVTASRSIFYGKYPYRMTVSLMEERARLRPRRDDWKDLCSFEHEFVDFANNVLESAYRKYWGIRRQRLYFSTLADLSTAYSVYKSVAMEISGPVTQEHLEVITSHNTEYNPRKTLYKNSFDCHVRIWGKWSRDAAYRNQLTVDMREFFIQSLTNCDALSSRYSVYAIGVDMYTNYDEFLEVMPFFKLQFTDYRINVVRCGLPSLQK